jgi:hypothetical protein
LETYLDGNLFSWTVDAMAGLPLTGSAYRAPNGEVVWIDPPDPGADEAALLQLGKPAHILVTFRDHDRAVDALAAKFGAKVWVPKGHGGTIRKVDVEYDHDTALPAGLKAIGMPAVGFGEHALTAVAYGKNFAFIGDAVFNLKGSKALFFVPLFFFKNRGGPLSLKKSYRGGDTKAAPGQVHKLLDLKLDAVFLSHGQAVPQDADRWLRTALGLS